jgi:hypothetical protein
MSADNQQGRPVELIGHYIAGFVDGEGSFHVAVYKTKNVKLGWQIILEFHVSQNYDRRATLKMIQSMLGCGYIKPNHKMRANDKTCVFVVRNHHDLREKVIPFFRQYRILSSKNDDFEKFARVVELMHQSRHLEINGLKEILQIAFSMNKNGQYRKQSYHTILNSLVPSETIRQVPPGLHSN